jgi:hypothetical protein
MRTTLSLSVFALATSLAAYAATPVARVISADAVDVDGITSPARNYVPVGIGGEVITRSATAVIQFSDGTSVVLQPNSQLKIDGRAGHPEIRVLRGAADYRMQPGAGARVSSGTAHAVNNIVDNAILQANTMIRPDNPIAEAVMYRGTGASGSGSASQITPGSAISVGSFISAPTVSSGSFHSAAGGGSNYIQTPSGLIINLTPAVDPTTGAVTYTVASVTAQVSVTVTQVINGTPVTTTTVQTVTSAPANLVGLSVSIAPPSTTGGTSAITFAQTTTTNGVTTSTPVAATTIAANVSTAVQATATTQAIQQATAANPTAPPPTVTTAPVTAAVSTGTFSSTAP